MNADDVVEKVFKEAWRGYAQAEVDEFLDRVADALREAREQREQLEAELAAQTTAASEASEAEVLLRRTLVTAQRTADETLTEAREATERMRAEAQREAERVRAEAQREAQRLVEDATRESAELIAASRRRAAEEQAAARAGSERIRQAVDQLHRLRSGYRERVHAAVMAQLEAFDEGPEIPPVPEELDLVAAEVTAPPAPEPAQPQHTGDDEPVTDAPTTPADTAATGRSEASPEEDVDEDAAWRQRWQDEAALGYDEGWWDDDPPKAPSPPAEATGPGANGGAPHPGATVAARLWDAAAESPAATGEGDRDRQPPVAAPAATVSETAPARSPRPTRRTTRTEETVLPPERGPAPYGPPLGGDDPTDELEPLDPVEESPEKGL